MTKRAAVLDLGTNTFQLLIAERLGGDVSVLHRDERWVNLAQDGIERIGAGALERMEETLSAYKNEIERWKPDVVAATGTAAFRRAANSDEARALVKRFIGVEPEVLSGDDEATLIYSGARWAANDIDETVLVMDIGGGSTEFIIGRGDNILWKKSYPLGATVLRQRFHRTEPIAKNERDALRDFVLTVTTDLQDAIALHKPTALIGCSGSFDSFASMLLFPKQSQEPLLELNADALNALVDQLCSQTEEQRKATPALVWFRVGPIVAAGVLTQTAMALLEPKKIYRSAYALKEGMLRRLLSL